MPIITIKMFEGRSLDQKRAIVKGITDVITGVTKCKDEDVSIIICEMKKENMALGGKLYADK